MSDSVPGFRPDAITAAEWRQMVQSATDTAIISTDRSGRVTSWNEGASRLLGWTEEEMLGQTLERLFEDSGAIAREIGDAISLGRGGGTEGWRLKKDGGRLWAVGETCPIRNPAGEITGFVKVLRDRTRARVAEEDAAEERRALGILNRAGSALAGET